MTSTYFSAPLHSQKNLRVKRNGAGVDISAVKLPVNVDWNLADFFSAASKAIDLGPPDAQRCFNEFGIEIVDVLEIHNGGIIYLAYANEKFISPHENQGRKEEGAALPSFLGQFAVGPVFCNGINNSQLTLCCNAENAECVVMKWIPKTALSDLEVVKKIEAEAQSLTALSHACITKLQSRLDTPTYVVFVFDPWKGINMKKYMCARGNTAGKQTLPNDVAYGIITQVLSAVTHMHVKGVVHGEISLENIFMKNEDSTEDIVIGGFHHAVVRSPGENFTPISNHNIDNSYKAPEYYTQTPIKGPPLDMWAVGVVYFAMLHGRFPFFGRSVSQGCPPAALKSLMFNVKTRGYEFDSHITREMKFAFQHMFIVSPDHRPDATYATRLIQGGVPIPETYDEKQGLISTTISTLALAKKKGGSGANSNSTLNTDSSSVSFFVGKEKDDDENSDTSSVQSARSAPGTTKDRSKSVKKGGGVGFFPSISGVISSSTHTSSSNGFLNKLTGGLFGQKDESKKGIAGGGGGGKDGVDPLLPVVNQDGMSSRLVNSTRVKVEEHMQKLQGMVTQTVEKSRELAAAGRKNKTIGGRTPVTKEKTNSRMDAESSMNHSSHNSSTGPGMNTPTVAELQAAMNRSPYQDDDDRTVRQPKPVFKARTIPEGRSGAATPAGDMSPRGGNGQFSPSDLSGALQSGGLALESYDGDMSPIFDRSGGKSGKYLKSARNGGSSDGGLPSISNSTHQNSIGSNSNGYIIEYSLSDSDDIIDTSRSKPLDTFRSDNPYGSTDRNPTIGFDTGSPHHGVHGGNGGNSPDNFALLSPSFMNSASDGRISPNSNSQSIVGTTLPSLNTSTHQCSDDGNHGNESPQPMTSGQNTAASNTTANHTNNINSGFVEDYSKYDNDDEYESTQFGFGVGAGKPSPSSKKVKKAGGGNGTSFSPTGAGKLGNRMK